MPPRRYAALLVAATTLAAVTRPSHAQGAGDGFLFRTPAATFGIHGGYDHAFAGSDLFAFVTKQLTLRRSDFSAATFGSTLALRLSPYTDVVLDASYTQSSRSSEFRDWIDNNDLPIQQTTSLRRLPVTIGLRRYVIGPGRAIGQFAWIPAPQAIYVGAGVGLMEYKFEQVGDFVDFQSLAVFSDDFQSQAWTPTVHALAGLNVSLGRYVLLTTEVRYTWARGPVSQDYVGFHRLDLSGLSLTTGVAFRLEPNKEGP